MEPRTLPSSPVARLLVLAYPPSLRRDYGVQMMAAIDEQWRNRRSLMSRLKLAKELVTDSMASWQSPDGHRVPRGPRAPKMRNVSADLRGAVRLFRRSPGFAIAAVLTLALGVGASTAILSLADATLLRPLPIEDPERVVESTFSFSNPDFRDLVRETQTFETLAAWSNAPFGLERGQSTVQVSGTAVSGRYFAIANQRALIGRLLTDSDDVPGGPIAAVISERLWERVYARDPAIVGTTVNANRRPVTIVGIVPAAFRGFSLQIAPEVFVPIAHLPDLATGFLAAPGLMENRGRVFLTLIGRLTNTAAMAAAGDDTRRIYYAHRTAATVDRSEWFAPVLSLAVGVRTSGDLRRFVAILLGAAGLAMLLTCTTVANLLLVRAERRRHELAVRMALGAGRPRLARLLLVESLAIGAAGGLLGVAVAFGMLQVLGAFALPGQILISDLHLSVNERMLGMSAALALVTAIAFGMAPVWQTRRVHLSATLRTGNRSTSHLAIRSLLVGTQIALCVLLLGGTVAFGRAIQHALALDLGFDVDHTSITSINPSLARYTGTRALQLRKTALDTLRARPEVAGAAWAMIRPLSGAFTIEPVVPGYMPAPGVKTTIEGNVVSDGYFTTLNIPLVAGRAFDARDEAPGAETLIISASLAERYWPNEPALGRRIKVNETSDVNAPGAVVVGVVADVRRTVGGPVVPMVFIPASQMPSQFSTDYLFVRTHGDPAAFIPDVRAALTSIDPIVPIATSMTMARHVEGPLMAHRLGLTLFELFAMLAAVLTALGLYAVVSTAVAQRTREIAVRVALGAQPSAILALVGRQGLLPVALGILAGIAAFASSAPLLSAFMFSLPPTNVGTIVLISGVTGSIAALAMLAPIRRAVSVDPTTALRAE